jgi:hypothetical protein
MPSYVRDRLIGLISLMIAILFTGVFITLYQLSGRAPSPSGLTVMATASGKIGVCGDLVASAIAIAGVFFDRKKAAALFGILAGLISGGLLGTFVFNI